MPIFDILTELEMAEETVKTVKIFIVNFQIFVDASPLEVLVSPHLYLHRNLHTSFLMDGGILGTIYSKEVRI